jgi:adenylate kinase family enzyme
MINKPNVILLLGCPGSGKGTQASKIEEVFSFKHISMGDVMRKKKVDSVEIYNKELSSDKTSSLSHDLSLRLLKEAINESGYNNFVLDGFHRKFDEFDYQFLDSVEIKCVILLKTLNLDIMRDRIKKRYREGQEIENIRKYDLEILEKRLRIYEEETIPYVFEYFNEKYNNVCEINCDGNIDEIFKELYNILIKLIEII